MMKNRTHLYKQEEIVNFWFAECKPDQWFKKDPKFDKMLGERFTELVEIALEDKLDSWSHLETGCLALILLLDQFTRNIFRDTPRAFAGDEKALELSYKCNEYGYLNNGDVHKCHFMLLPMMHSEEISVQDSSLSLFKNLNDKNIYDYALRHRDIIKRFGRFPHRNSVLRRKSSEEEIEFLTQIGSSF